MTLLTLCSLSTVTVSTGRMGQPPLVVAAFCRRLYRAEFEGMLWSAVGEAPGSTTRTQDAQTPAGDGVMMSRS